MSAADESFRNKKTISGRARAMRDGRSLVYNSCFSGRNFVFMLAQFMFLGVVQMRVFRMDADVAGESTTVVLLTKQFDTIFRVSHFAKSVRRDGF